MQGLAWVKPCGRKTPPGFIHIVDRRGHQSRADRPYLAVWTVQHLEQRPPALPAHLQVVCGVDDLDAEVQRLKKQLASEARADDPIGQEAGRGPERPQVAAGRSHALGVARRQVAQAGADEAVVDDGEEGLEEPLHCVLHVELGAHQEEADIGEELPHGAHGLAGQAAVRLLQGDVGVILRLPRQGLEGVCGRKVRSVIMAPATSSRQIKVCSHAR